MKLYSYIELILLTCIRMAWKCFIMIHEILNIWHKRKLIRQVRFTPEQKKQIDEFFIENYGKRVPYWWHRLYQSYTGRFDAQYMPEYIFSVKLEPKTNTRDRVFPLEDKNMLSVLFDGGPARIPETYVMCVKGRFFDGARRPVSRDEAAQLLRMRGDMDAVVKAAVDSSSGRDVHMLSLRGGVDMATGSSIEAVLDSMGSDFVVQEKLHPQPEFAAPHPDSINTLRVVTYMCGSRINAAPIIMRIGRGGNSVDNAHAGGIFVGVRNDGSLMEEAYTEYQKRFKVHPDTKVVFGQHRLPFVSQIRQAAIELHSRVPALRFVSWDFTVDDQNRIVLIETNLHSQAVWVVQYAHGKAFFGEDTAQMLREAGKGRKRTSN